MRKPALLALLGVCLSLACQKEPATSTYLPPPTNPTALHVAFDDIPAEKGKAVPMSLTASTGAGLALVSLTGRAVIDDPLAFTELHLVFENPEDRVLEGSFSIVLPQGAAISRFAMKNDQGFQEGEVVEKKLARAAYEDFLHHRQDPALLEQAAGNEFSARVFPIPARGRKELVVSYQQELTTAHPYVLPLVGLPRVGTLDVEARVVGHAEPIARLSQHDAVPTADLRVEVHGAALRRVALRNGDLVVTRVAAAPDSRPEPLRSALILVDTSASRALGMVEAERLVAELCETIGKSPEKPSVLVAAYDQGFEPIFDGPASAFGVDAIARIRQRLALGASDLGAALVRAGVEAKRRGIARVVLVTDGIPTAGATSGEKLRAIAAGLRESGVERLDAIAVGGIRDDDLLKSLANAGLPHGGVVVDAASADRDERWRRLNEATRSGLDVSVEGAKFVFPRRVDGAQAGDEVIVYAQMPEAQAVRISIGGAPAVTAEALSTERPLLERAWVGAKIRSLLELERTGGPSDALSHEIIGLSTRYRVLSPKTALLVLESDADYDRFGIDRRALTDILVAEGGRVRLQTRSAPILVAKPAWTPPPRDEAKKESALDRGGPRGSHEQPDHAGAAAPPPGAPPPPAPPPPPPPPEAKAAQDAPPPASTPARRPPPMPSPPPQPSAAAPMARPSTPIPLPPAPMAAEAPEADARPSVMGRLRRAFGSPQVVATEPEMPEEDPYTGPFKTVMTLLAEHRVEPAVQAAFEWRKREPGDVMALVALGEGFEAAGDAVQAARSYGSIIDLFPARADLRRFAGERLERLPNAAGLALAQDSFAKALEERADHPSSHRLHAYALLRQGHPAKAFDAIVAGLHHAFADDRFPGVRRILAEDVGLIGAAWAAAEPARAKDIARRVVAEGGTLEDGPSIRFVLNWETDANDVDFHIFDAEGGHAFYQSKILPSGGELYADITQGYGPECFTIRGAPADRHGPYKLKAHYYSRGPMGYGMGKLEIIEHDGKGGLRFEERPYVVMVDHGFVDLGTVAR